MSTASQVGLTYRFDRFAIDVSRRTLSAGPQTVGLSEKLFRILCLLVEAQGGVVTRAQFLEAVWPDEPVSEANLTQHLSMLRALLRDRGADESIILTVPGSGYRLGAAVEKKMGLLMKLRCERCQAELAPEAEALICSYECTFCVACGDQMSRVCPNCGGELTPRPRRKT
jgi:DNA-binding winged helix-turn-helix (wHTH) protein